MNGLLLDESNPRRSQESAPQLQTTCALALQNLALSDIGKAPLRAHHGVLAALRLLVEKQSLSEEARQAASGALFELDEEERQRVAAASASEGVDKATEAVGHIMLSYNWDHQDVIKRINTALKERGYSVWIDVEKMQGSTVEVMAAAVEDASAMVYGVSRAYKESANCRLEAQYAFQKQKDMIPVMLEDGYSVDGWLGMLVGVRLWYGFYGAVLASDGAFNAKVDELCRELGGRGKTHSV